MNEETFPRKEVQIWRYDRFYLAETEEESAGLRSVNIAAQSLPNGVLDPCTDIIDPGGSAHLGLAEMPYESENFDIVGDARFDIPDELGIQPILTGCTFSRTVGETLVAGTLACDNNYSVNCRKPFDDLQTNCGTRCNDPDLDCLPNYRLLARCQL